MFLMVFIFYILRIISKLRAIAKVVILPAEIQILLPRINHTLAFFLFRFVFVASCHSLLLVMLTTILSVTHLPSAKSWNAYKSK